MSKNSKKKKKAWTAGSPNWMVSGSVGKGDRADYQDWRSRGFFSAHPASEVRHIDPKTGMAMAARILEDAATDILKAEAKLAKTDGKRAKKRGKKGPIVQNSPNRKEEFYHSWEWRKLRLQVLTIQGRTCKCCGATAGSRDMAGKPTKIVVDHIKPISKFWNLRLQASNLQVLCDECNQGKGNWIETDFSMDATTLAEMNAHSGARKSNLPQ